VRRVLSGLAVLLAAAVLVPVWAADEKPQAKEKDKTEAKDKKDKEKAPAKEKPEAKEPADPKSKMVLVNVVRGKLMEPPKADKLVVVGLLVGKNNWKRTELPLADDVKVRMARPPVAFDDKGRVKRYTSKELADLKGPDKSLPGYTSDVADLKRDQLIEVHLYKKKGTPKLTKEDKEVPAEYKPQVAIIVILSDTGS